MSDPWDRQRDGTALEPLPWYERFLGYLYAEKPRSMLDVYRQVWAKEGKARRPNGISGAWDRAVKRWHWQERAEAYDLAQLAAQSEERRKRQVEREAQTKEDEWRMAERLLERAEQMLTFPVARVVTQSYEDGREKSVIEPMAWRPADAVRFTDMVSKLRRLSAGMNTEQIGIRLEDVLGALPRDYADAVRAALAEHLPNE